MQNYSYATTKQILESDKYPFTFGQLRHLLINRDKNGLTKAVRKIGKRLYFRRDLFEDWIESNVDFENEVYSEKKRYKRFKTAICGNNEC